VRHVSPGHPPLRFAHSFRALGAACAATIALLSGAPLAAAFDDEDRHGYGSHRQATRSGFGDEGRGAPRWNPGGQSAFGLGAIGIGHHDRDDEDRHHRHGRHSRRGWHHGNDRDDWRWHGDRFRPCPPRGRAFGWHRPAPFFRCGRCGYGFASRDSLLGHAHHHHGVPWHRARHSIVELNLGFIFR
jgi:hypothetical protein